MYNKTIFFAELYYFVQVEFYLYFLYVFFSFFVTLLTEKYV